MTQHLLGMDDISMAKWAKQPSYYKMWKRYQGKLNSTFYSHVIEAIVRQLNELDPNWRLAERETREQLIEQARAICRADLGRISRSCKRSDFDRVFPQVRDELSKL